MLIILEGPDGTGKTTFAERLEKELRKWRGTQSVRVLHKGPPTSHPLDEYVKPLLEYRPGTGHHIICDRWHWGEVVYPAVLKRDTQMDDAVFLNTEMFLQSRGALVVNMKRSISTLQRVITERGDDLIRPDHVPELVHAYNQLAAETRVRVINVNATAGYDLTWHVVQVAETFEVAARQLSELTTYVGPPRPHYLLVGDTRNKRENHHRLAPAFGAYPATSGHYLAKSLSLVALPVTYCMGIINANDVDDIRQATEILRPGFIVALGANAHHALGHARHGSVPHPQYVRRFHHHAHQEYGTTIVHAALNELDLRSWRPS